MKYFELLYLAAAVALAVVLMQEYESMSGVQNGLLIAGIVIFSFMFSFRRTQRQRMEQNEKNKKP